MEGGWLISTYKKTHTAYKNSRKQRRCYLFSHPPITRRIFDFTFQLFLFFPPFYHQSPCACIAAATLEKPAMLLPATRLGNSPSAGSTYSLAVSSPFLKHDSMMLFNLLSTSSDVQAMRWEFWAISSPDTATPPALAALPVTGKGGLGNATAFSEQGADPTYLVRTKWPRPSSLSCGFQRRQWPLASNPCCFPPR